MPRTPSADAVACEAIPAVTRVTGDDDRYPSVAVRRGKADDLVSGGPTHTGRPRARPDPADGPARRRDARDGTVTAVVMTADPALGAGHETGLPCHGFITGTFYWVPRSTCTTTELPPEAARAGTP